MSVSSGPEAKSGIERLKRAPASALQAMRRGAGIRSAILSAAPPSAPTTNPICTLIVIQACPEPERFHSRASCGTTADAENQSAITSSWANASSSSVRRLARTSRDSVFDIPRARDRFGLRENTQTGHKPKREATTETAASRSIFSATHSFHANGLH